MMAEVLYETTLKHIKNKNEIFPGNRYWLLEKENPIIIQLLNCISVPTSMGVDAMYCINGRVCDYNVGQLYSMFHIFGPINVPAISDLLELIDK